MIKRIDPIGLTSKIGGKGKKFRLPGPKKPRELQALFSEVIDAAIKRIEDATKKIEELKKALKSADQNEVQRAQAEIERLKESNLADRLFLQSSGINYDDLDRLDLTGQKIDIKV